MAETVHLFFRTSGGLQRLPGQLITPQGTPSTQFTEVSGLTMEVTIIGRSRKFALRVPLSRESVSVMPVLKAHCDSKQPIAMALCTNEVLPSIFQSRTVSRIEDCGSSFMVEIDGVSAGA
jgi:hypothetical protein